VVPRPFLEQFHCAHCSKIAAKTLSRPLVTLVLPSGEIQPWLHRNEALHPRLLFMKVTIKTQGQQFTVSEGDILIVNRFRARRRFDRRNQGLLAAGEGADFK